MLASKNFFPPLSRFAEVVSACECQTIAEGVIKLIDSPVSATGFKC